VQGVDRRLQVRREVVGPPILRAARGREAAEVEGEHPEIVIREGRQRRQPAAQAAG